MTVVMDEITATQFKARCLSLLDDVAESGAELLVTKRGRPVARVVPVAGEGGLRGSVTYHVGADELIAPIDVAWGQDSPPDR